MKTRMMGLPRRRLHANRLRRWLGNRLLPRKRRERRLLLLIKRSHKLLPKIRRSRRRWLARGRKKRRTEGDRRVRLPNRDNLKSKRLRQSSKNSKLESPTTSLEKMKNPEGVAAQTKTFAKTRMTTKMMMCNSK